MNALRIVLVSCVAVAAAACSASYPTEPTRARPVALYLAYTSPKGRAGVGVLAATNAYGFIAYTINADGAYERVSDRAVWSSSNDGIVRAQAGVSATGKFYTAVAPGAASVVARLPGLDATSPVLEATAPVLVVESEVMTRTPRIDLTWNGVSVVGASSKATALLRSPTGSSQDVSNGATWTSSDPAVASVTGNGSIRSLRSGTTIITANVDGMVDWFWFSVLPGS